MHYVFAIDCGVLKSRTFLGVHVASLCHNASSSRCKCVRMEILSCMRKDISTSTVRCCEGETSLHLVAKEQQHFEERKLNGEGRGRF
jgi:hypothetical protein